MSWIVVSIFALLLVVFARENKYDPTTLVFPPFLHVWVQKATATHLKLYTKNQVEVRDPQGVAAVRLDSWEDAKRPEDDDELTVYGVNGAYDMIIYNTSMSALSFYGINARGEKRLRQPHGIAAHHGGDVYVADTGNHRVVHLYNSGRELQFVCALTGLNAPHGVAVDEDRTVYVADTGNNRIVIFRDDQFVRVLVDSEAVQRPTAVAVSAAAEPWSYFHENSVVVVDQARQRIQKFSVEGKAMHSWQTKGLGRDEMELGYLALDYYDNVYVTDRAQHCIHKLDRQLNYLAAFGRKGKGEKEFYEPRGIAIYKRFGQVIVAERASVQYYWVGTDVFDFKAGRAAVPSLLQLDYFLTEASYIQIEIFDGRKNLLATPCRQTLRFAGTQREVVDGDWRIVPIAGAQGGGLSPTRQLTPVKAGGYLVRLTIKPTYSSYKNFEKSVEVSISFGDSQN
ncbi:MAG: NHL repeat-containing protein [bacterium]